MHKLCCSAAAALIAVAHAQVLPPANGPVRMGHLHIVAANPADQKRFWTDGLGAQYVKTDAYDLYKIPGVLIVVQKGDAREGTAGSVVNHVAFLVRDLDAAVKNCSAAGAQVITHSDQQAMLNGPANIRVELTAKPDLATPIAHHHIHFYSYDPNEIRNWYTDFFDAKPGMRGRFKAADLPGVNLTFAQSETTTAPTKGRALDHIGFEVQGLEAFTKKLQASGLTLTVPYRQVPSLGIAIAFVTDPWGTYIELTEGLDKVQ